MPTMTTPQEIAAAIEEALDLGGHLLIRFAHAQVRQLKSSEVELLVDTLKADQPEERRRFKQGERVIVATPSGHLEDGIVHEDIAAIWVKHDNDGVLRPYKASEVSLVSPQSPSAALNDEANSQPKEK